LSTSRLQAWSIASRPNNLIIRIVVDLFGPLKIPKRVLAGSARSGHKRSLHAFIAMVLFDTTVSFGIIT
jgi:hypothetical protein